MKRRNFIKGMGTLLLMLYGSTPLWALETKELILGSTQQGSWGYAAVTAAVEVFESDPLLSLKVNTRPATDVTWHDVSNRKLHLAYGSSGLAWQAWNDEGPFSQRKLDYPAYQTLTIADSNPFVIVPASSEIENWEDLRGKRLFPIQEGFGNYEALKAGLKAAEVWEDIIEVQMNFWEAPEAFLAGEMDACGAYIMGGVLPAWDQEIDQQMEIRVISPTEKHIQLMEERLTSYLPGTFTSHIPLQQAWQQDVGRDEVAVPGFTFGLHAGQHVPEDTVYQFVSSFFQLAPELRDIFPGYETFYSRGEEINLLRARSIPQIPLHPGMASYMKEKGFWDDRLEVGKVIS